MINELLLDLKIETNNKKIFEEAFTHTTFANEKRIDKHYQRLEFLGDALLHFLIAEYIYKKYKKFDEGKMSILRAKVVSTKNLSKISDNLKLINYIKFGNSKKSLINNNKIKADIFESLVGAIYISSGHESLINFLKKNLFKEIDKYANEETKNPKTILQEFLQSESRNKIEYITVLDKNKVFFNSKIIHDGNIFGKGIGKTKKEAEINAANEALKKTKRKV